MIHDAFKADSGLHVTFYHSDGLDLWFLSRIYHGDRKFKKGASMRHGLFLLLRDTHP